MQQLKRYQSRQACAFAGANLQSASVIVEVLSPLLFPTFSQSIIHVQGEKWGLYDGEKWLPMVTQCRGETKWRRIQRRVYGIRDSQFGRQSLNRETRWQNEPVWATRPSRLAEDLLLCRTHTNAKRVFGRIIGYTLITLLIYVIQINYTLR